MLTGHLEYTLADTGQVETDHHVVTIPDRAYDHAPMFDGASVREAAALYNTVVGLVAATNVYFADLIDHCADEVAATEPDCADTPPGVTCEEWITQELERVRLECLGSTEMEPDVAGGLDVLAEHDLPIDADEPCQQLLCVRTATAVAPTSSSRRAIGLRRSSSSISTTWSRRWPTTSARGCPPTSASSSSPAGGQRMRSPRCF